jgi:long-chain acyl-CoA synthetase
MNLKKIEQKILSLSSYVKEIKVVMKDSHPYAIIRLNLETLKAANIINLESEIRWYAIELFNMDAEEEEKVRGYEILIDKVAIESQSEPDDEIYKALKTFLSTLTKKEILLSSHLELDLRLDSLNYVELFIFIEESFGVLMNERIFAHNMRMDSLYKYIKTNGKFVKSAQLDLEAELKKPIDEKLVYSPFIMFTYKTILFPLFKLYFSLEVTGRDKIPNVSCIIAPCHQSMLDGFLIESTLPYKILKNTFFLAFKQVFGTTLLKPISKYGQSILIDANENLKETMRYTALPLREGNKLVIFPEGARTRDRKLLEFRPFFAMLSKTFNVPVVPVVIDGSFEALKSGKIFPKPKKIKVTYLDPIYPNGLSYDEITQKTKSAIEEEMKASPVLN